jgi:hypothetical protein
VGKRFAPEGPSYKALVVNNETIMDFSTAQMLLDYGHAGLSIVWVGPMPNATFSHSQIHYQASLSIFVDSITALATTNLVSDTSAVPAALASLGVMSSVQYSRANNDSLITYWRNYGESFLY